MAALFYVTLRIRTGARGSLRIILEPDDITDIGDFVDFTENNQFVTGEHWIVEYSDGMAPPRLKAKNDCAINRDSIALIEPYVGPILT